MARLWRQFLALTPLQSMLIIFILALIAIGSALTLEAFGYAPCELCLEQRIAYYFGIPISLAGALVAALGANRMLPAFFVLLGLIFGANAVFGVYHSGVEWTLWQGPTGCTGSLNAPTHAIDLMKELNSVKVVACDKVQLRILGLSLANLNALVSAAIALVAAFGAKAA